MFNWWKIWGKLLEKFEWSCTSFNSLLLRVDRRFRYLYLKRYLLASQGIKSWWHYEDCNLRFPKIVNKLCSFTEYWAFSAGNYESFPPFHFNFTRLGGYFFDQVQSLRSILSLLHQFCLLVISYRQILEPQLAGSIAVFM